MNVLKVLRLQRGWSVKEICKLSGMKEGTYIAVESGKQSISLENAKNLAELLDVETEKLFEATRLKPKEIQDFI